MLTQQEIDALLRERHGYVVSGKADRVAQVDKALGNVRPKPVELESAEDSTPVESAVKRGPGRPRKS